MKISALILAGGIGSRMKANMPKQFIEVDGVPIIVRTIRNFQINNRIDSVTIVCVKDYIEILRDIVNKFGLTKVTNIVEGGQTGHDSSRNGVLSFADYLSDDDFVIIHDAVRPLLPQKVLDEMIDLGIEKGNACLAIPCYETVVCTKDGLSGDSEIDRSSFVRVQTPQIFNYKLIRDLYLKAEADNRHDFIYANTMAIHYGTRLYFSSGFTCNYKITTPQDIALYKALLSFSEDDLARK